MDRDWTARDSGVAVNDPLTRTPLFPVHRNFGEDGKAPRIYGAHSKKLRRHVIHVC